MPTEKIGVYYHPQDYAAPGRRGVVFLVDLITLLFLLIFVYVALLLIHPPPPSPSGEQDPQTVRQIKQDYMRSIQGPLQIGCLVVAAAYHVLMWTLPGGTLGYRLAGVRLVNGGGDVPRLTSLLKRFVLGSVTMVTTLAITLAVCVKLTGVRPADGGTGLPPLTSIQNLMLFGAAGVITLLVIHRGCFVRSRRQAFHDVWSGTWVVLKHAQPAGPALRKQRARFIGPIMLTYWDVEPISPSDAPPAMSQSPATTTDESQNLAQSSKSE